MPRKLLALSILCALLLTLGSLVPTAMAQTTLATPHTFWDVRKVAEHAHPSVVGIVAVMPPDSESGRSLRFAGTGIVYRAEGYIITNAHLVYGATEVLVLLPSGVIAKASSADVWADHVSDIAVIRIHGHSLKAATFADSDQIALGQLAVAIGNPLGFRLGNTVSVGVISGKGRMIGTGYPYLQTDAAINPGNSGGPLLNESGQVVGVITAKLVAFGLEGLGFAVPALVAMEVADTLIVNQKMTRPWLGLFLVESDLAMLGLPTEQGLYVSDVYKESHAAGLIREGDELLSVGTSRVATLDEVAEAVSRYSPRDFVGLTIRRDGKLQSVTIRASEMPNRPLWSLEEEEEEEPEALWTRLTPVQVAAATKYARENLDKTFETLADGYLQQNDRAAVFLQTEFMHVAYSIWEGARRGAELDENMVADAAARIHGQIEILMMVQIQRGTGGDVEMTLRQGSKTVSREIGRSHRLPYGFRPPGLFIPGISVMVQSFRVNLNSLDLTQPLIVHIAGPEGKESTFRYNLNDLR